MNPDPNYTDGVGRLGTWMRRFHSSASPGYRTACVPHSAALRELLHGPLFPPGSPYLKADRIKEPEQYSMSQTVPAGVSLRTGVHLVRESSGCPLYRFTMDRLSTWGVRVILRSLTPIIHPVVAHDSNPATSDGFWQLNGVLEIFCGHGVSPVD
jgi:hypothetical protein